MAALCTLLEAMTAPGQTAEPATLPLVFGTLHLGSLRGLVAAITVGSTAFGPVLFAVVREKTGGYGAALLGGAVLPLLVAVAAVVVRPPPTHS